MQHNNKKVEANKQVEELEQVEKIEGTQDSFKRTLLVNAVIGGAAGLCASKLVGFQEGTVGGLAGGLVFALIKLYRLT